MASTIILILDSIQGHRVT